MRPDENKLTLKFSSVLERAEQYLFITMIIILFVVIANFIYGLSNRYDKNDEILEPHAER
jgi:cell division protein FtsL